MEGSHQDVPFLGGLVIVTTPNTKKHNKKYAISCFFTP